MNEDTVGAAFVTAVGDVNRRTDDDSSDMTPSPVGVSPTIGRPQVSPLQTHPEAIPDVDEQRHYWQDAKAIWQSINWKTMVVLLCLPVILTLQHYLATRDAAARYLSNWIPAAQMEMWNSLVWCGLIFLFYFLVPLFIVKVIFREKASDYGLSFQGLKRHWVPYAASFLLIAPVVVLASRSPAFQQMYPFYAYVSQSPTNFIIWELAYGLQFLAVEFLFRGFGLFGLKKQFGIYSLFIMAVPYCMIHFPKPMGEAFGAVFAGVLLGYFALKSRSVFGGVAVHWLVAMTMDLAAILQK